MAETAGWEVQAATNEVLFRTVNDRIRDLNEAFGAVTATWQVKCECSESGCLELLDIEPAAYEELRSDPRRFVLAPDHVDRRIEHVVAGRGRHYVIVEKHGRAGEVAEQAAAKRAGAAA